MQFHVLSAASPRCSGGGTSAERYILSGPQRGPAERGQVKNVKIRQSFSQKVSNIFSTLFDNFRAGQRTSKIVKKCQTNFRNFSTIFAQHQFSGPFWGALIFGWHLVGVLIVGTYGMVIFQSPKNIFQRPKDKKGQIGRQNHGKIGRLGRIRTDRDGQVQIGKPPHLNPPRPSTSP